MVCRGHVQVEVTELLQSGLWIIRCLSIGEGQGARRKASMWGDYPDYQLILKKNEDIFATLIEIFENAKGGDRDSNSV